MMGGEGEGSMSFQDSGNIGTVAWVLTLLCSLVGDVVLLGLYLLKESRELDVCKYAQVDYQEKVYTNGQQYNKKFDIFTILAGPQLCQNTISWCNTPQEKHRGNTKPGQGMLYSNRDVYPSEVITPEIIVRFFFFFFCLLLCF